MIISIEPQVRDYIATAMVAWLRDPNAGQDFIEWTPRSIRDHIEHMIPIEHVGIREARRIANGLTRWMGSDDGYIQVRYQRDRVAFGAVSRIIEDSIGDRSAEKDDDIVDDLTAPTYPRLLEWIEYVRLNMREFAREQAKIGTRPKRAKEMLLRLALGSIEDALAEC